MKAAGLGHQYLAVQSINHNGHRFGSNRNIFGQKQIYQPVRSNECAALPSVATERALSVDRTNDDASRSINVTESDSNHISNQADSMMDIELEPIEIKENPYKIGSILPKRQGRLKGRKLPLRVRRFYRRQDSLIDSLVEIENTDSRNSLAENENLSKEKRYTDWLVKLTVLINFILLACKIVAAVLSRSLSIISAVVDSAVDTTSACLLFWAVWAIKNRNPYKYPGGRTRLEPVIVVILSVAMVSASVQVIFESTESLINDVEYFQNNSTQLRQISMGAGPITIMSISVAIKIIMAFFCFQISNPIMNALGHDHLNDVFANGVALMCGSIASAAIDGSIKNQKVALIDPIGAIVVSLYIILSWGRQLRSQVRNLSGYKAEPEFIQKITWLTLNHSPFIQQVDNVRAFHFGTGFLVEIELILPESMSLREAHGISRSLKERLEKLSDVELAFVNFDYSPTKSEY